MKIAARLFYNTLIGGIFLILINMVTGLFHYHLPLNPLSALAVGSLGIPGIALLVVLKYMLNL